MTYTVTQRIKVEAEDYEAAIDAAFDVGFDEPNASDRFEMDSEPWCSGVYNEYGDTVYPGDEMPR